MNENGTNLNHEPSYNILFVDDEFDDVTKVELHNAVSQLRDCGYNVDTFLSMSAAIGAFMGNKFYHVMIVDIDMHKTLGYDNSQDMKMQNDDEKMKSGRDLAKVYMSLDNGCRVIIYSGAGTVDDMFNVTNCHVYGYVQKKSSGGPERLVEKVKSALSNSDMGIRMPDERKSGRILIITDGATPFTDDEWEAIFNDVEGSYTRIYAAISQAKQLVSREQYAVIIIAAPTFSVHDMDDLEKICAVQPRPHVVMACNITSENDGTILNIVNLRPLRLVDLCLPNKVDKMTEALRSALKWYDGWETFESSLQYVRQFSDKIDWEAYEDDNLALTEELDDELCDDEILEDMDVSNDVDMD